MKIIGPGEPVKISAGESAEFAFPIGERVPKALAVTFLCGVCDRKHEVELSIFGGKIDVLCPCGERIEMNVRPNGVTRS